MKYFKSWLAGFAASTVVAAEAFANARNYTLTTQTIAPFPQLTSFMFVVLAATFIAFLTYHINKWLRRRDNTDTHTDYIALAIALSSGIPLFFPGIAINDKYFLGLNLTAITAFILIAAHITFYRFKSIETNTALRKSVAVMLTTTFLLPILLTITMLLFMRPLHVFGSAIIFGSFFALNYMTLHTASHLFKLYKTTGARAAKYGFLLTLLGCAAIDIFVLMSVKPARGDFKYLWIYLAPYVAYKLIQKLPESWQLRTSVAAFAIAAILFVTYAYNTDYLNQMTLYNKVSQNWSFDNDRAHHRR